MIEGPLTIYTKNILIKNLKHDKMKIRKIEFNLFFTSGLRINTLTQLR